jgi:hypothetical protein
MRVGHFAIGLIGKRAAPRVSLAPLVLASMLADVLGFIFVIVGLEHWRVAFWMNLLRPLSTRS